VLFEDHMLAGKKATRAKLYNEGPMRGPFHLAAAMRGRWPQLSAASAIGFFADQRGKAVEAMCHLCERREQEEAEHRAEMDCQ
jgi:hypothetical protein